MSQYKYRNQVGNEVQTTSEINMVRRMGPMSFCGAIGVSDQHGCKYREEATNAKHCMYWREDFNGACDCLWAQRGIEKPKEEDNDEVEQAMTIVPT
jgi:hypothetical protein